MMLSLLSKSLPCGMLVLHNLVINFYRCINSSISSRMRSELLIDYNHFQILTSTNHVDKPQKISVKKASIVEERAIKVKKRELTKIRIAKERTIAVATKIRKATK